ncbi:MAG: 50S ribosomal protein L40e [Candidatus Aenigmatarchaeota archaeon]
MGPAFERLFKNVFVCLRCKGKMKADPLKVKRGLVNCRRCGSYKLRPKAKEPRGVGKAAGAA